MKTLRNILLSGIAGLSLATAGCQTTFHGYVDASYVPERIYEKEHKNELRTETDIHSETPIGKTKLTIGENIITYSNLIDFSNKDLSQIGLFNPKFVDYQSYIKFGMPLDNLKVEFYIFHNCFHPIGYGSIIDRAFVYSDNEQNNSRILSTGETRIGVRIEY